MKNILVINLFYYPESEQKQIKDIIDSTNKEYQIQYINQKEYTNCFVNVLNSPRLESTFYNYSKINLDLSFDLNIPKDDTQLRFLKNLKNEYFGYNIKCDVDTLKNLVSDPAKFKLLFKPYDPALESIKKEKKYIAERNTRAIVLAENKVFLLNTMQGLKYKIKNKTQRKDFTDDILSFFLTDQQQADYIKKIKKWKEVLKDSKETQEYWDLLMDFITSKELIKMKEIINKKKPNEFFEELTPEGQKEVQEFSFFDLNYILDYIKSK